MDLDTEPIVRATSLAAHGSFAPVAGGPASSAMAAAGAAVAISPARRRRRLVAVPVVMDHSLGLAKRAWGPRHVANGCGRRLLMGSRWRSPPGRFPSPARPSDILPSPPGRCHRV